MTSDLNERLARANPVSVPDEARPDAELLRAILATPPQTARRRPRARYLAAAATAVGVAVVLVVAFLPGERLAPSPAAAQALERLAVAASAQPAPPAGHWAYTRARTLYAGTNLDEPPYSVLFPAERESWVAADGAARIVERPGKPIFLNESDRRRWQAGGGRMEAGEPTDRRYRTLPLSHALYADVAGLPTEPDALEAELRRRVETQGPPPEDGYSIAGELRSQIGSLLHSPASSGELRAALYRVLARLPHVELVGEVVDPAGRKGIGLKTHGEYGEAAAPTSRLVIVDPATGDVLAEQSIIERRVEWIDAEPGDVYGEIVYLEQGWTNSVEERP